MSNPKAPSPRKLFDYLEDIDPALPDAALAVLGGGCKAEYCHCREVLAKQPEKFVEMMRERAVVTEHALKTAITNVQNSPELSAAREASLKQSGISEDTHDASDRVVSDVWAKVDKDYELLKAKNKPIGCLLDA